MNNIRKIIYNEIRSILQQEKLDPVGKEDADVNNDGKIDSQDKYLLKRRKAISKATKKEQHSVGHVDDESGMLKADLYHLAKYAADLYKMVDNLEKTHGKVDFPQWWQEKVIVSRKEIDDAKHYLEYEFLKDKIDNNI
jgi:hypothetical protein